MDWPSFSEELLLLDQDVARTDVALRAAEGPIFGRNFQFVECLRRCRASERRGTLEFQARRTWLTQACEEFKARNDADLDEIVGEALVVERRITELSGSIAQLKTKQVAAVLAAEQEERRVALEDLWLKASSGLRSIGELRQRCDEMGRAAQHSGSTADTKAFYELVAQLAEHHGGERRMREEIAVLESRIAELPQASSTNFDPNTLFDAQSALGVIQGDARKLIYRRAALIRQSKELAQSTSCLAQLGSKIAALSDLQSRVSAQRAHIRVQAVDALHARGVRRLFHFTPIGNLPGILSEGIRPRADLEHLGTAFIPADDLRLDGLTNTVSLSIEFPNYRMLFQKLTGSVSYAILELDVDLLSSVDALFHQSNAAAAGLYRELPPDTFFGATGVAYAFDGGCDDAADVRAKRHLAQSFPIDPQAEVLVCSTIAPTFVRRVIVQNSSAKTRVEQWLADSGTPMNVHLDAQLFGPRGDWEHWKQ